MKNKQMPSSAIKAFCLALVGLGMIFVIGGVIAYRAEKYFETELNTGKYSLNTAHKLLEIRTEDDLSDKKEKDLYKIALKYRDLSIMFNNQLIGLVKIFILSGVSLIVFGYSTLSKLKKIKTTQNQGVDPTLTGAI